MRNIPDFAMQIVEIEKGISGQAEESASLWKDDVQKRYYSEFIERYYKDMEIYIQGGQEIISKGLNDLLVFTDEKLTEMEQLTGVPADVAFTIAAIDNYDGGRITIDDRGNTVNVEDMYRVKERGGIVHNPNLDRDYWEKQYGPVPGELKSDEVKDIMKDRD